MRSAPRMRDARERERLHYAAANTAYIHTQACTFIGRGGGGLVALDVFSEGASRSERNPFRTADANEPRRGTRGRESGVLNWAVQAFFGRLVECIKFYCGFFSCSRLFRFAVRSDKFHSSITINSLKRSKT